ncbi:MAG: PH domain-containing protein [Clostridia bacterium]|nr:PH domain-containing protein [Clostridia bacterium]
MARKQTLRVSLKNVNNIYLERSLWGRLLGYATITVASSRGSISVKNVANAETFAKELAKVTIGDENNFLNL